MFGLERPRWVDLPTYAFQRQRYWPRRRGGAAGDVALAGLGATGHPLLGAVVELADGDGAVFTGHLSVRAFPWLADHAVLETVLLPGTAFVELVALGRQPAGLRGDRGADPGGAAGAARAGRRAGSGPRRRPRRGRAPGGQRALPRRSPPMATAARGASGPGTPAGPWSSPPSEPAEAGLGLGGRGRRADAEAIPVEGSTTRRHSRGIGYGPAFRGWRRPGGWAMKCSPRPGCRTSTAGDAGAFGVHPALLDAGLHAIGLAGTGRRRPGCRECCRSPGPGCGWRAAARRCCGCGCRRARTAGCGWWRWTRPGGRWSGWTRLVLRPVSADQLRAARAGAQQSLFAVDWAQLARGLAMAGGRWAVLAGRMRRPGWPGWPRPG